MGPPTPLPDSRGDDPGITSSGDLAVLSGGGLTLWSVSTPGEQVDTARELRLRPDRPAVIGRQEGGRIDYLDPAYQPTQMVPETGQCVVRSVSEGPDRYVSRGHFTLHANAGGILLVNGVPRPDGGVRPPLNGTWLMNPVRRALTPGEEYLIARGAAVVIRLPNEALVRIRAG